MNSCKIFKLIAFAIITIFPISSFSIGPIALDSRIKTYIYSPSEVFPVYGNYMYQSYIEFDSKESIKTIAVGDSVSWSVNPAGRRIFIRPFEKHGKTNMIVITNLNTYVFDLVSEPEDNNVMYVVKFVQSDKLISNVDLQSGYTSDDEFFENDSEDSEIALFDDSDVEDVEDIFTVSNRRKSEDKSADLNGLFVANKSKMKFNRNYSVSGDTEIKPMEVFDNKKVTVVKFKEFKNLVKITGLNNKEQEYPVEVIEFEGYLVIKGIHEKLVFVYKDRREVTLYNNLMV